jgi:hypothetical protein
VYIICESDLGNVTGKWFSSGDFEKVFGKEYKDLSTRANAPCYDIGKYIETFNLPVDVCLDTLKYVFSKLYNGH